MYLAESTPVFQLSNQNETRSPSFLSTPPYAQYVGTKITFTYSTHSSTFLCSVENAAERPRGVTRYPLAFKERDGQWEV
jgi:hypothetical protein